MSRVVCVRCRRVLDITDGVPLVDGKGLLVGFVCADVVCSDICEDDR